MGQTIAKFSTVLDLVSGGLTDGLSKASQQVTSWTKSIGKTLGGAGLGAALGGVGAVLSGALRGGLTASSVGSVLGGALGGAAGVLGSLVGGPFGAIGGALVGSIAGGMLGAAGDSFGGAISELAKRAEQGVALGVSPETFTGLTEGFKHYGVEGDKLVKMLGHLSEKSAEAGITGANLDERISNAAEAIKNAGTAAQQATKAQELFGGAGIKLLPILKRGAEGIRDVVEEQKDLGGAIGNDDFAKLQDAHAAMQRVGDSLTGMWNKVLVAAAPVITFVADGVAGWIEKLSAVIPWTDIIQGGFILVAHAVSNIIDAFTLVSEVGGVVWQAITETVQDAAAILMGAWAQVGGFVTDVFQGIWDSSKAVISAVQDILSQMVTTLADSFGGLFKWLTGNSKALGITISTAFKVAMPDVLKLSANALNFDDVKLGKVQAAFAKFGLTGKAFDAAFAKLTGKKFEMPKEEKEKAIDVKGVAAAFEGSKEAAGIEANFAFGGLVNKEKDQQLAAQKEANDFLAEMKDFLEQIAGKPELGVL